jgi:hypothetical protein
VRFVILTLGALAASAAHAQDTPRDKSEGDLFAEGAIWVGKRFSGTARQDWKLVVTERKGTAFKAEVTLMEYETDKVLLVVKVSGTAAAKEAGPVRFKSEKKGFFQQAFAGQLKNGEVALSFSGITAAGTPITGTARLKPEG